MIRSQHRRLSLEPDCIRVFSERETLPLYQALPHVYCKITDYKGLNNAKLANDQVKRVIVKSVFLCVFKKLFPRIFISYYAKLEQIFIAILITEKIALRASEIITVTNRRIFESFLCLQQLRIPENKTMFTAGKTDPCLFVQ